MALDPGSRLISWRLGLATLEILRRSSQTNIVRARVETAGARAWGKCMVKLQRHPGLAKTRLLGVG